MFRSFVQRLTGRPLTSLFIIAKPTAASHALRPKLGAGLAVGVGTAYAAFSTPTAGCAPTTRGGNAGVGAAAASPQAHTGGQNQPDAIHGNQCQVCQDYFSNGAAVSTAEVCEHKVCEFCFQSLDSRACVACRRDRWRCCL